jgi:hypothetical protein
VLSGCLGEWLLNQFTTQKLPKVDGGAFRGDRVGGGREPCDCSLKVILCSLGSLEQQGGHRQEGGPGEGGAAGPREGAVCRPGASTGTTGDGEEKEAKKKRKNENQKGTRELGGGGTGGTRGKPSVRQGSTSPDLRFFARWEKKDRSLRYFRFTIFF